MNFAEKWFNSIFDSILFTKNSIQTIIKFKIISGDSIQNTIQFNSQGIIDTGQIWKMPKKCPKGDQNKQKQGAFYHKFKILIQYMILSFISR